jgi:hypothetical protein
VGLDRRLGDHDLGGDLGVRQPRVTSRSTSSSRSVSAASSCGIGATHRLGEALHQPLGDGGLDERVAGGGRADGSDQP